MNNQYLNRPMKSMILIVQLFIVFVFFSCSREEIDFPPKVTPAEIELSSEKTEYEFFVYCKKEYDLFALTMVQNINNKDSETFIIRKEEGNDSQAITLKNGDNVNIFFKEYKPYKIDFGFMTIEKVPYKKHEDKFIVKKMNVSPTYRFIELSFKTKRGTSGIGIKIN